jgi:hypothetical protein
MSLLTGSGGLVKGCVSVVSGKRNKMFLNIWCSTAIVSVGWRESARAEMGLEPRWSLSRLDLRGKGRTNFS